MTDSESLQKDWTETRHFVTRHPWFMRMRGENIQTNMAAFDLDRVKVTGWR